MTETTHPVKNHRIMGVLAASSAAFTAGLVPVLTKLLMEDGLPPAAILFYRYLMVFILLGCLFFIRKPNLRLTLNQAISLILYSIIGYGGSTFLLAQSFDFMPIGQATMLYFSYPLFVVIIMTCLFKEKLDNYKLLALTLAVSGILFLINFKFDLTNPGALLGLSSGLAYGIYLVALQKSSLRYLDSLIVIFYLGGISSIFFGLQNLVFSRGEQALNLSHLLLLLMLAGITIFVLFMVTYAIKTIGSAETSLIIAFEAVVTLILGIILFKESFNAFTIIGAILMFSASVIISYSSRTKVPPVNDERGGQHKVNTDLDEPSTLDESSASDQK